MRIEKSCRVGLIAKKIGMTQIFQDGKAVAVTLLKVDHNVVVSNKTVERDGYNAVVLGYGVAKANAVNKPQKVLYSNAGVEAPVLVREFRVSVNAMIPVGSRLSVEHFVVGQYVDVQSKSIGKGFAGGMKRWNFRGLEASHGVSVSHRSHGSTGQRQDPGKVFKGKKMAGHLGVETVSVQNIKVAILDVEMGLIGLHGSVPGKVGTTVLISDAVKLALPGSVPFPAFIVENESEVSNG